MALTASTAQFLVNGTSQDFACVLKLYPEAVKIKAAQKNKKKGESLQKLDKWCQEELGGLARARDPPHITQEELVRLMDWKLSRGKFRPRLMDLAASNSEDSVKKASKEGIKLALKNKVEQAIKALVVLKGVGPATASGVLAACVPENCCFFADEVAQTIPSLSTLKYTAAEYELLISELSGCAQRLNKEAQESNEKENGGEKWNPHTVELAVWTHCLVMKSKPELLTKGKRSNAENGEEASKKRKK